jgi:hypothetical protein
MSADFRPAFDCEYRGIEYCVWCGGDGLYHYVVDFPDRAESGCHKREDTAFASAENLIDDFCDSLRERNELWEHDDELDDDRDQSNPAEYSDGYDFAGHDFDSDPDWR